MNIYVENHPVGQCGIDMDALKIAEEKIPLRLEALLVSIIKKKSILMIKKILIELFITRITELIVITIGVQMVFNGLSFRIITLMK
ncbi:MAG: hypothetical protein ACMUIM_03310 [bacterium]